MVELLDGKYQIEQLLGKGGMGAVYRATHLGTRRTVAVKVIHPELSMHSEFVARFRREAEAAGRLRHPNVCRGEVLDPRSDIYSLGVIAYRLLTGATPKHFGFNFSMSGLSALYQLLNVFVTPLTAIMLSLLYLKTRRAGGESLKDTTDQFEALDIPRSKWQSRMRSRYDFFSSSKTS